MQPSSLSVSLVVYMADGEDYLPANLGVVFSVGVAESQEVCFSVTIIDDDVAEGEEYFPIEIVSVSQGATFGSPNITDVVIIDNDGENQHTPSVKLEKRLCAKAFYYSIIWHVYSALPLLGTIGQLFACFLSTVVTVRFEEAVYSVVESEVAVVCVIADGRIDSPFTVSAITSDITAVGRS